MKRIIFLILGAVILGGGGYYYFRYFQTDETGYVAWQKERVDAAFAPTDCEQVTGPTYGDLRYDGQIIDTHYHIPNLPDHPPVAREARFNPITPQLGLNLKMADIVCTLSQDGTKKVFAFFPIFPEFLEPFMDLAGRTMKLYPDTFVPFIMPPERDNNPGGYPTVDAETLREYLVRLPIFQGFGEIGLYERDGGAKELPPDSPRLTAIYPVLREHNLVAYFHLGEGQKEAYEKILEQNPDVNFIWHGDQLSVEEVEDVMRNHPNVYYTVDELYGDRWMIHPDVTKEEFLAYLENYEALLEKDLATWKGVIERNPNQFMWGTDRSPQVLWSHDPVVGQALVNYARAFIARLDPAVQENFAYKNAERVITTR